MANGKAKKNKGHKKLRAKLTQYRDPADKSEKIVCPDCRAFIAPPTNELPPEQSCPYCTGLFKTPKTRVFKRMCELNGA